jgi:4-diphosphocytidyl-2-C-methyl-D-erythritol kinase
VAGPGAEAVVEVAAPAKVNLGLRVVGVRPDGYHELESLFLPLDLSDRLSIRMAPGHPLDVTCSVETAPGVPGAAPAGSANLAARAARAFLERSGLAARVAIHLEKRIPSPGGLGGGSSDAAAVLRALAARFPGALGRQALAELALGLGADVPFFLGPEGAGPVPARVGGIGERIAPVPGIPSLALVLVHPGPGLETARVYAEFDAGAASLTGSGRAPTMPAPRGPAGAGGAAEAGCFRSAEWLVQAVGNDLEPAARRLCPAIVPAREALAASGALAVGLSGSGPTLFGIFRDAPAASRALEGPPLRSYGSPGTRGWVAVARTAASGARA